MPAKAKTFVMSPTVMYRLSLDTTFRPTKAGQLFKYKVGRDVYFKLERKGSPDEWIPMQGGGKPKKAKLKAIMDAFADGEALFDPAPYRSPGLKSLVNH